MIQPVVKLSASSAQRLAALFPDAPPEWTPVQKLIKLLRDMAKKDMYFLAKAILGYKDLVPYIHGKLCRLLEDGAKRRIRVTLPRGFFKSTIVSIVFPIWLVINDPNARVLLTQNTLTNACKRLSSIDSHFKGNQVFRAVFHDLLPDKDCRWNNSEMTVKRTGIFDESTFTAAGTQTKVVSNHYDVIIEDDTVTPDLDDLSESGVTPSPEDIQQAIGWHKMIHGLFQNPATGRSIVVGTRWAQLDLLSWIRDHQPEYQTFEMADVHEDGSPTFPERFDLKTLEEIKNAMGPYLYACNYQNSPMRSEDMVFQPEWFQYYASEPEGLQVYTTVDPSGDPTQSSTGRPDFNAIVTTGKDPRTGLIYVLETWRKRCNPGEMMDALWEIIDRWHPLKVGPEIVAYQNTMIYWFKEKMRATNKHFVIEPIRNNGRNKLQRIMGLQPLVSNQTLLFRKSQRALVSELEAVPIGANDDLGDALAMHLQFWRVTAGAKTPRPPGDTRYLFDDAYDELMKRGKPEMGSLLDVWGTPGPSGWSSN